MADLKESLLALVGDEGLVDAVMAKVPQDKKLHLLEDGQFVPKSRFDEVNEQKNTYKKQSDELNAQVSDLSKFKGTAEELQKQLGLVQSDFEKKIQDAQNQFALRERDLVIDTELSKMNARNPKAVKALLDLNNVKIADGKVEGLNEQLQSLMQSDAYLFNVQQQANPSRVGLQPNSNATIEDAFTEALRKATGLPPKK